MKKITYLLLILMPILTYSQECQKNETLLSGSSIKQLLDQQEKVVVQKYVAKDKQSGQEWLLTVRFGPSLNWYGRSDISINTSRVQLELADVKLIQRSSMKFYNIPKSVKEGNSPFQILDEPSNLAIIELEKKGKYVVGLAATHNKTIIPTFDDVEFKGKDNPNSEIQASGQIDGTPISGEINLPYVISNLEFSELFYHAEVFAQKIFPVVKSKSVEVNSKVGGGLGIYMGTSKIGFWNPKNGKYSFDRKGIHVQGYNASAKASLEVRFPKSRWSIQGDYEFVLGSMNANILDGEVDIPKVTNHRVGATVGLRLGKKKEKKIN